MDAPQITESPGSSNTPPAEQHPILPLGSWMWKQARKLVVFVIGMTVVLIGIILIFTPGPALIVIPCGLAILATEFVWAKRLLAYAKRRVQELTQGTPSANVDATVPFDAGLQPMVGTWKSRGQIALIVQRADNKLVLKNPENETWRFEISDTQVEGKTIKFTQRSYLRSHDAHPFSGVACKCEIQLVDGDPTGLLFSLMSPDTPEPQTEILRHGEQP